MANTLKNLHARNVQCTRSENSCSSQDLSIKGEKEVLSERNEFFSSIADEEKIVAISGLSSDNDAK